MFGLNNFPWWMVTGNNYESILGSKTLCGERSLGVKYLQCPYVSYYRILTLGSITPYKISAKILMRIKKVAATSTDPMTTG
jgi:hypothetical protein